MRRLGLGLPGPFVLTGGSSRTRRPTLRAIVVLIFLGLLIFEAVGYWLGWW